MTDDDFDDAPKIEGDTRTYYPNRPLAQTAANRGQMEYRDQGVYSAYAQFEPSKGFVAVLFSPHNIPEAWEAGFEVQIEDLKPAKTPEDWASPKAQAKTATGGSSGSSGPPVKGATARVWAIAEEHASGRVDRNKVIEACVAEGINKSTAATQWSKFAKAKGW